MDFSHPPADPVPCARQWIDHACSSSGNPNPDAIYLSTVDPDGRPSIRTVLMKGFDEDGLVFFTNKRSRKGRALEVNPRAAILFHWDHLQRQLLVEGDVTHVDQKRDDEYFQSRGRDSQIGAVASLQSESMPNRGDLEARFHQVQQEFADGPVRRPAHWGGYRVSLGRLEFWEAGDHRLHDRICYERDENGGWTWRDMFP